MSERSLVIGGTGMIGFNLVRHLILQGECPRVLIRDQSKLNRFAGMNCEIVFGDVTDKASLVAAMEGIAYVYNTSGMVALGPFLRAKLFEINVNGVKNILDAAIERNVRRVVHTSTVSTVGKGSVDRHADENSVFEDAHLSPYWMSKKAGEELALNYAKNADIEVVVVNPSFVLGPYDFKPTSGEIIIWSKKLGGLPFYARGSLNAVHVDDVSLGQIAAMKIGRPGERYILGNENLTHRQLLDLIAEEIGVRKPFYRIPYTANILALIADFLGRFFPEIFNNWNSSMLKVVDVKQYVTCKKAQIELGLPQTPVRKSIKDAYNWFSQEGRL